MDGFHAITNGQKLTISPMDATDSGNYTCQVTFSVDSVTLSAVNKTTDFNIRGFSLQPEESYTRKVGDSLTITCHVKSDTKVEIKW